jgi:hypothetical protein
MLRTNDYSNKKLSPCISAFRIPSHNVWKLAEDAGITECLRQVALFSSGSKLVIFELRLFIQTTSTAIHGVANELIINRIIVDLDRLLG